MACFLWSYLKAKVYNKRPFCNQEHLDNVIIKHVAYNNKK